MCYGTKTVKWGAVAIAAVFPSEPDQIPSERVSVSDLPPVEVQVIASPAPPVDPTGVLALDPTPAVARLPAPERVPVIGGRRAAPERRCRPGFCIGD